MRIKTKVYIVIVIIVLLGIFTEIVPLLDVTVADAVKWVWDGITELMT